MSPSLQPYEPSKVLDWNRLTCQAVYYTKTPPTVAARAFALVHTAMYDAWSNYTVGCQLSTITGDRWQRPASECTPENREKAFAYAAYFMLKWLFEAGLKAPGVNKPDLLSDQMEAMGYKTDEPKEDHRTPEGIGFLSARYLYQSRLCDGSNQGGDRGGEPYSDYTGYVPVNPNVPQKAKDLTKWQPQLRLSDQKPQKFATPHWAWVRPFGLTHGSQYRPPAPKPREDPKQNPRSAWAKQFMELVHISECLNQNEEHKISAEYWAGMHEDQYFIPPADCYSDYYMSPPPMLCRILHEFAHQHELQNSACITLFFAASNAMLDAGIAAWDAKRYYDYVRPVTVIREELDNATFNAWGGPCQTTVKMQGEGWQPYLLQTPPFAEYVSGHSTFSAAVAEIVTCMFGHNNVDLVFELDAKQSKIEQGCTPKDKLTLCWSNLSDAADAAGMSRRYGGIHFEDGDLQGRALGKKVAQCVWGKVCDYFNGEQ